MLPAVGRGLRRGLLQDVASGARAAASVAGGPKSEWPSDETRWRAADAQDDKTHFGAHWPLYQWHSYSATGHYQQRSASATELSPRLPGCECPVHISDRGRRWACLVLPAYRAQ